MRIIDYLKSMILKICYGICIFAIVNIVLITSRPIAAGVSDIAYMDLLFIAVSFIFIVIEYRRWKYSYNGIYKAAENGQDLLSSFPDTVYYSEIELIRKVLITKDQELMDKLQEAKEASDEVNDYITKWVHEIKMPIAVCELIADKLEDDTSAEELRRELDRLKFLINQVLYTSRASSFSEDLQVCEISLEKIVSQAVKRNVSFFISKHISLELNDIKFSVLTDEKWMTYIIDQIINNACKYVDRNGKIDIYGEEDAKTVKLHIKDDGLGIKHQDVRRIFDRGFTGSNGRETSKSTGMGLYLSKKAADMLKHKILVESREGKGTEFIICFYKMT